MPDGHSSGEINVLILARITEVASKVESVASGQNDLKMSMMMQFNDGKHRMNGLEMRIDGLEHNGCKKLVQHQQDTTARMAVQKSDEESDWKNANTKPQKHRPQRETPTDRIAKKLDLAVWIKYGAMIGAAVAGAYAAVKAGGVVP